MATVALMLGEIALLSLVGRAPADLRQIFRIELPAPTPAGAVIERRVLPLSLIIAAAVLAVQFGASLLLPQRQEIVPSRAAFTSFPSAVLSRKAQPLAMEEVYQQALNMDDYLLADYVGADRSAVNLYIAYYGSQRKGQSVHSPRSCLPGGGWQMRVFGQRELPGIRYNGQPVRVNRAVIELGNQRSLVYYWFVQRGRIITNEYAVKWYLFWDSLTRQRTDGALVRLGMPLPSTASMAHADEELTAFAAAISPVLPQFVRN
jgi:EpsI family protein